MLALPTSEDRKTFFTTTELDVIGCDKTWSESPKTIFIMMLELYYRYRTDDIIDDDRLQHANS